jgi:hypothetical protein
MKHGKNGKPAEPPALAALRRSAQRALAEARDHGTPCYVWQDGKVVDIATSGAASTRSTTRAKKL